MNGWLLDQEIDLSQPISRQYTSPYGIAMTGDDRAQRLRYTVYDGQTAANLSGTLKAYFRRPDDTLIEATASDYVSLAGNVVTVQPPPEAYAQKGLVECIVKLYATDGKVLTLARCDLFVERGVDQDDTIIPAAEASRASMEDRVAALEVATGVVPIDQLPSLARALAAGDYFELDDGNGPYKIDYEALASAIISKLGTNGIVNVAHGGTGANNAASARANLAAVGTADIANNLTTTAAGKVLDARQGKVLNDKAQALQSGLAIIVDGDTASAAVPVGGYAYIRNNTHGLAEGLYTNTSSAAFPASGGTANSSVFTAVSGGSLNAIQQSTAVVVYGTTPSGADTVTWETSGINLENKYLVCIQILNGGNWYIVSQGGIGGISVAVDGNNVPLVYLPNGIDAVWLNARCRAIYVGI